MIDRSKRATAPFIRLPITALTDIYEKRLRPIDICILSILLSNQDNWIIRQREIARRAGLDIKTVKASFSRLATAGWIEYRQERSAGGKYGRGDWIVRETPALAAKPAPDPVTLTDETAPVVVEHSDPTTEKSNIIPFIPVIADGGDWRRFFRKEA